MLQYRAPMKLGLLAVLWIAFLATCWAAPPFLSPPEQEVLQGFLMQQSELNNHWAGEQVLLDVASPGLLEPDSFRKALKELRAKEETRGIALKEAVDAMVKKNEIAARVALPSNAPTRIHLVPTNTFPNIVSGSDDNFDDWLLFYERFPNSAHIITVSRVGIDSGDRIAVLCFSARQPGAAAARSQFQIMRRAGTNWVVDRYDRGYVGGPFSTNMVTVACELRYYVGRPEDFGQPPRPPPLRVLANTGTNLVCSIPAPLQLLTNWAGLSSAEVRGFVLQVVEPKNYAGKPMTLHFYDHILFDAFRLFEFGKRYEFKVAEEQIDNLDFDLGY